MQDQRNLLETGQFSRPSLHLPPLSPGQSSLLPRGWERAQGADLGPGDRTMQKPRASSSRPSVQPLIVKNRKPAFVASESTNRCKSGTPLPLRPGDRALLRKKCLGKGCVRACVNLSLQQGVFETRQISNPVFREKRGRLEI